MKKKKKNMREQNGLGTSSSTKKQVYTRTHVHDTLYECGVMPISVAEETDEEEEEEEWEEGAQGLLKEQRNRLCKFHNITQSVSTEPPPPSFPTPPPRRSVYQLLTTVVKEMPA